MTPWAPGKGAVARGKITVLGIGTVDLTCWAAVYMYECCKIFPVFWLRAVTGWRRLSRWLVPKVFQGKSIGSSSLEQEMTVISCPKWAVDKLRSLERKRMKKEVCVGIRTFRSFHVYQEIRVVPRLRKALRSPSALTLDWSACSMQAGSEG